MKARIQHVLSLRFNGHFPGGPGLAGTRMSPFWTLLELMTMEVVVTTGIIRRAKLQSKCHRRQTKTQIFFTRQMPFQLPNQQCQSTEGIKNSTCPSDEIITLMIPLVIIT